MNLTTSATLTLLALIASFTTIVVLNDSGEEMEPTHYCSSIGIKMYCSRTTDFYCYPKNTTRLGSKKCSEGWTEIPIENIMISKTGEERIEGCSKRPIGCK